MQFQRCYICLLAGAMAVSAQQNQKGEQLLNAARHGELQTVKQLVEGGANIESKNKYGITPLFYAAWSGHEDVVRYLLSKGANPEVTDSFYKMSLLAAAISKENAGAAVALVEGGAKVNGQALEAAASGGMKEVVAVMLAKSPPPSADQLTKAAQSASESGKTEVVALLVKAGAAEPKKAGIDVPAEKLARLTGKYTSPQAGEVILLLEGGKLMLRAFGTDREMLAYDDLTFTARGMQGMQWKFAMEGDKPKALELSGSQGKYTYSRVEPGK